MVVQGKARRRRIANLFKEEQRRHAPPQPRNPPRSALTHWVNLEYAYFLLLLILLTHSRSGQLLFLGLLLYGSPIRADPCHGPDLFSPCGCKYLSMGTAGLPTNFKPMALSSVNVRTCFCGLKILTQAQCFADRPASNNWPQVLNQYRQRINPLKDSLLGKWYYNKSF